MIFDLKFRGLAMKAFGIGAMAALAVFAAGQARAQVISDVNYVLNGADPTMSDHYHNGCSLHAVPGLYELQTLTVTVGGNYQVTDLFASGDASMAILDGPFVPAAPATNCIFSIDDNNTAALAPGAYTLVLTTLGGGPSTYAYRFNGPGAVSFAPGAPLAVPTLSEWAMILFGALLLAGGGWMVQRRRTA